MGRGTYFETTHDKSINHILHCNPCFQEIAKIVLQESARKAGSTSSKKKAKSSKLNGMKGGRPRSKR